MGSKPIGAKCFQYLLNQAQELSIEIVAVKTIARKEMDQDLTVEQLAIASNIPLISSMDDIPDCDIIYSVQHHEILKKRHIDKAKEIAVNLHLAPLPEYRGCNQFSFAIMDGVEEFGVTIHKIDEKIDHGDLIFESRFPIEKDIWVKELVEKSTEEGIKLFQKSIKDIVDGNYKPRSYKKDKPSQLHYRADINDLKQIDPNLPYSEIKKRIRATAMPGFEPPYYWKDGRKIYYEIADYKA